MKNLLIAFIGLLLIASCKKKDEPIAVDGVAIPSTATVEVNLTMKLTPTVTPENAADKSVTWTSSNNDIAAVADDGTVTGKSPGTAVIKVTSKSNPDKSATCTVTVTTVAVDGVTIPLTATVEVNHTVKLTPTVTPENATDKSLTWTSSNANIAAVADDGTVTGKSIGTVIIEATSRSNPHKLARCALTVIIPVASISVDPTALPLAVGAPPRRLRVVVAPEFASNKNVTYVSSDPLVASVSETGLVTALAPGTTTITVTSVSDPTKTATCAVTVLSNDASVSAIALGDENFPLTVPADGRTTTLTNAPRTIASALATVKVTLTAAANATIKIGDEAFANGGTANFNGTVTFTVTAQDGTTVRTYMATITPYNAETNPYGIYTPAHLNDVRNDLGASYKMKNDIPLPDRNAAGASAVGISDYATAGWTPIGAIFTGKFDGGNFSINNFYINRGGGYTGLFGELRGAVRNLGITGSATPAVTGGEHVGALAGRATEGSVINNCYAHVAVHSALEHYEAFAGGLIGYMRGGSLSNSYSSGNVSGNLARSEFDANAGGLNIGGLVGLTSNGAALSNCFSTGTLNADCRKIYGGGLAGHLGTYSGGCTTANCYATGNVACLPGGSGIEHYIDHIGISASNTFTNCYRNSNAVVTSNGVAKELSPPEHGVVANKTREEMQTDAFKGNLNGESGTVWGQNSGKNGGLPYIIGVGVGKP